MFKKFAFTLSEILITLAIIGVIAAITIPIIHARIESAQAHSVLEKAISELNQALKLHYSLEGLTSADYKNNEEVVNNIFKKRLNVIDHEMDNYFISEICKDGANFITADGISYCLKNFYSDNSDKKGSLCDFQNTKPCVKDDTANIWIDINGDRKPNKITLSWDNPKDIYQAQLYSQRVVPFGQVTQEVLLQGPGVKTEKPPVTEPEDPSKPVNPDPDEPDPDNPDIEPEPNPDNPYYDLWDPDKMSWRDFLNKLREWLGDLFDQIFG